MLHSWKHKVAGLTFASHCVAFISFCFLITRYVSSWIETREVQSERANLTILFDKYVPTCLDTMKVRFKKITPIADISHLQMLCFLLECMLTPENTPPDTSKEVYELYFVFCCVWAFGGCLFQDQVSLRCPKKILLKSH